MFSRHSVQLTSIGCRNRVNYSYIIKVKTEFPLLRHVLAHARPVSPMITKIGESTSNVHCQPHFRKPVLPVTKRRIWVMWYALCLPTWVCFECANIFSLLIFFCIFVHNIFLRCVHTRLRRWVYESRLDERILCT